MQTPRPRRCRVVVVDDSRKATSPSLGQALACLTELEIVGTASDVEQGIAAVGKLKPDVVFVDFQMLYINCTKLFQAVEARGNPRTIIVSEQVSEHPVMMSRLQALGAESCIDKREMAANPAAFASKILAAVRRLETRSASATPPSEPLSGGAAGGSPVASARHYPVPHDEAARIVALRSLRLDNAEPERQLDLLTSTLAKMTGFPICLMTFIDGETQWLKSSYGLAVTSTPRALAFCNHTICQDDVFSVEDAISSPLFRDNPLVTGEPKIRSYVGHPVTSPTGVRLGALCLIDTRAQKITPDIITHARGMAKIASEFMQHRAERLRIAA